MIRSLKLGDLVQCNLNCNMFLFRLFANNFLRWNSAYRFLRWLIMKCRQCLGHAMLSTLFTIYIVQENNVNSPYLLNIQAMANREQTIWHATLLCTHSAALLCAARLRRCSQVQICYNIVWTSRCRHHRQWLSNTVDRQCNHKIAQPYNKVFISKLPPDLFWTMRLIFLRATYWTSGSPESRVTSGGDSFFSSVLQQSDSLGRSSRNFISTLTADSTTAELAWERRGVTRSQMLEKKENRWIYQCNLYYKGFKS